MLDSMSIPLFNFLSGGQMFPTNQVNGNLLRAAFSFTEENLDSLKTPDSFVALMPISLDTSFSSINFCFDKSVHTEAETASGTLGMIMYNPENGMFEDINMSFKTEPLAFLFRGSIMSQQEFNAAPLQQNKNGVSLFPGNTGILPESQCTSTKNPGMTVKDCVRTCFNPLLFNTESNWKDFLAKLLTSLNNKYAFLTYFTHTGINPEITAGYFHATYVN